MKKHDKINLDSISNIDEKIIDEVTDKKLSLLQKLGSTTANARKKLIAIASLAASFALIFSVLLVIFIPLLGSDVPVYQGMTVRKESTSALEVPENSFSTNGITLLSASGGNGLTFLSNSNGNAYGHGKDNHVRHNDKLEKKIEDMVTINIVTDNEIKYYVQPGETFIIEIHIDNPKNYEIQSFTLNGEKYANYMFKEGSTMELLLLEVTAPDESGYKEYTIDAIKYIDGTEIKDVDMSSGDKSVKVGITYPTAPSASVTSQSILPTSIELSVNVSDPYRLIGQNELAIYLTDGENIIGSKPLTVGDNSITFDNLTTNTAYEYGVVAVYDLVDGKDLHKEWLITNTITTSAVFGITNAIATQNSISFDIVQIGENGIITSVSLYDAVTDELVASGDANTKEFKNLLSYHTYNLYVDFTYTLNGKTISDWVAIKSIKTTPHLAFNSCKIINTDTVFYGDTIFMQAELVNPSGAKPTSVIINGREYACTSATTATKIYIELSVGDQFEGGNTTLTVETIHTALDGQAYATSLHANNTAEIFINARLAYDAFEFAVKDGEDYVSRDYVFPSEDMYAMVHLLNKTGYTVDSVTMGFGDINDMDNYLSVTIDQLIKLDDDWYAVKLPTDNLPLGKTVRWNLDSVAYHNEHISTTEDWGAMSNWVFRLSADEAVDINTPEDLLNMDGGCLYVLQNDIDLSGRSWTGNSFSGVFDGNGYAIENMTVTMGYTNDLPDQLDVGLFTNTDGGIIMNLTMKSVFVSTNWHNVGGFVGSASNCKFINCEIDQNSLLMMSEQTIVSTSRIGGFVGDGDACIFIDCISSATVTAVVGEYTDPEYAAYAAGFVGTGSCEFTNCISNATVSGATASGFCHDIGGFTNCVSNAAVSGQYVSGFSIEWGGFYHCTSNATLTLTSADGAWGSFSTTDALLVDCEDNATLIREESES